MHFVNEKEKEIRSLKISSSQEYAKYAKIQNQLNTQLMVLEGLPKKTFPKELQIGVEKCEQIINRLLSDLEEITKKAEKIHRKEQKGKPSRMQKDNN